MTQSSPASPRMSQLTTRSLARCTSADLTRAAAATPGPRPDEVDVAYTNPSVGPGSGARSIGSAASPTGALG